MSITGDRVDLRYAADLPPTDAISSPISDVTSLEPVATAQPGAKSASAMRSLAGTRNASDYQDTLARACPRANRSKVPLQRREAPCLKRSQR